MAKPFTTTREAIVAVLDQHASITSLTGRQQGNVMSFKYFDRSAVPGLFFQTLVALPRVSAGGYEVSLQLTAIAKSMSDAEELLSTAVSLLTPTNFEALGYDMAIIEEVSRDVGDIDFSVTTEQVDTTERADVDLTLWITI